MAQLASCLPDLLEALGSTPNTSETLLGTTPVISAPRVGRSRRMRKKFKVIVTHSLHRELETLPPPPKNKNKTKPQTNKETKTEEGHHIFPEY